RRLTPRELELCLRGDLDAIVRKAIRKEPHLRYTSAETFADDIDRYLETRPVAARRGTWRYRGGRFVRRLFFAPDTRRRHERWAWTAGLLATLALLPVAAWVQRPPPLCEDANARFDDAWGSAASDAVQDSFLATGLSFADDTFRRVDARLDAYSRDWIATDTEICRATLVRAERSPRLLDLGRLCLEGRREELRSLVELFSKADSTLVTGAVAAVHQLGDIRSCADQVELATRRLPPTDPVVRERLGRIRKVVEAQLLRSKIKLPVDFAVLESAENEVRELDDPPLLARTLFAWGQALAYEKGGAEEGIAKLEDALRFAIGGGDRPLQTEIYAALVKILTRQRGDFERARFWKGFAEASLESLSPGYPGVEYAVYDALGMLAWETAESDLAMSLYRQALESAERQGDPLLQASALSNLGMVDGTATLRAVELLESELGPDHPRLAAPRMNLAAAFASEGRYDEALPLVRQAYQVRRAAAGSDHPELAHPLALSGQILVAQDRPEEALEPFQEALLLLEPTSDTRSQIVRDIQVSLCEAFLLLDRLPDAEAHIVAASSKFGASVSPGHPSRLNFLRVQGDYYRQSGQLEDALAVHQELLALLGPTRTRSPGQAVWPLAGVAKTLLAAGRPAEARGLLEEAWESVSDGDRRLGAEIALDLAGTIRAEDPARASALVEAARKRLSDSVPLHRKLREEIAAMWGRV
ncbi:MAG: tetratricopeptide repeat protein, partial [Thermoanaerobaculia bacterium]|nr:tetratricopeptide repeat protein [Thermoanaerobaculia bacterium]